MYTSPNEVLVTKNSNLIQDAYCQAYKAKYKVEPFVETEDLVVFSFLSKNFGLERGSAIARHYLTMLEEWFLKNAHNPTVLRKNVQKVIADLGTKEASKASLGRDISTHLSCDNCHKDFIWVGNPDELARSSYLRACEDCKSEDNPNDL